MHSTKDKRVLMQQEKCQKVKSEYFASSSKHHTQKFTGSTRIKMCTHQKLYENQGEMKIQNGCRFTKVH